MYTDYLTVRKFRNAPIYSVISRPDINLSIIKTLNSKFSQRFDNIVFLIITERKASISRSVTNIRKSYKTDWCTFSKITVHENFDRTKLLLNISLKK